eukprot:Skav221309  [mRNA]  locus=scaffold2901:4514:11654:+ [translate_table: standard]
MAELSKKLGLFERVRSVCQSVAIPLPGVVVVGEQSAGKSSLLENISGIQFPRAQNTCTRMPCVLTLLTDRTVRQPFAEVSMNSNFADAMALHVRFQKQQSQQLSWQQPFWVKFLVSDFVAAYVRKMEPESQLADEHLKVTMAELSKKLGLFERVRSVCQSVAIPLPGVVVVGEQSAGKSSLLENISGIQFPRAQNTCTRMPCVLTLLTDRTVRQPFAEVSMNSNFADARKCSVPEVEGRIKELTEQHATGDEFISSQALEEQCCLGLLLVTVNLVEEYIKPEEMVILCVIPAMSDFGNAEVLMKRESDVRLELGFHCVVNRSQKNIDDAMKPEELWDKEEKIFTKNERMRGIPEKNWGTLRLMKKVAKIQEARVDECLPKIKETVRRKTVELRDELRSLPAQADSEADQFRLFNGILSAIRKDLISRIRAEFMSVEPSDRQLTIAPKVASMIQTFRKELLERNPDWLGEDMIEEVDDMVQHFMTGFTVENLIGPNVFIKLMKQTFIEEGLLRDSVRGLVTEVAEHLRTVVQHVVRSHANINGILPNHLNAKAEECIDQLTVKAREVCEMLAEAQQVTSTTHSQYMVKLTQFRKSWLQDAADGVKNMLAQALLGGEGHSREDGMQLPDEFLTLVDQAQEEPQKFANLEICASLHVYTGLMIEGFVEMSAKLVKFNMVEQLADKLEEIWREELGGSRLHEMFPKDETMVRLQEDFKQKIKVLEEFKEQMMTLRTAVLPVQQKGRRTLSDRAQARADAKAEEAAARKAATFTWDFAKSIKGKTFENGDSIESQKFTLLGVPDLTLTLYPAGDEDSSEGFMSLYLSAPVGWRLSYQATLGETVEVMEKQTFDDGDEYNGWCDFCPSNGSCTKLVFKLLEAIPAD